MLFHSRFPHINTSGIVFCNINKCACALNYHIPRNYTKFNSTYSDQWIDKGNKMENQQFGNNSEALFLHIDRAVNFFVISLGRYICNCFIPEQPQRIILTSWQRNYCLGCIPIQPVPSPTHTYTHIYAHNRYIIEIYSLRQIFEWAFCFYCSPPLRSLFKYCWLAGVCVWYMLDFLRRMIFPRPSNMN